MNPDPSDCALLLPWFGSWNCLKNSSNGEPGGNWGNSLRGAFSEVTVDAILTTEEETWSDKSAKLSGGAFDNASVDNAVYLGLSDDTFFYKGGFDEVYGDQGIDYVFIDFLSSDFYARTNSEETRNNPPLDYFPLETYLKYFQIP